MANLTNINNKFLVTDGGKVGIGITAPTGILHTDQTFSGYAPVTFKNSVSLAKTFSELPVDKILVETDSPYLSPEPLRGRSNEPSNIIHTVEFLSKIKNISYDKFSKMTTENFFSLFGKFNEK